MESQNGYPVLNREDAVVYNVGEAVLPLAPGNPGKALNLFAKRFNNFVEPLRKDETWGFARRKVGGSDEWSNHASATAVDFNSLDHVQGRTGTFDDKQVAKIRKIQDDFDGIIKWGGDYRNTKDEMHFEINEDEAAVTLVVRRLERFGKVYLNRLLPGKRNLDVYMVKRELRRQGYDVGTFNNYFGVSLTKALRKYQSAEGLNVNGAADKRTLERLGLKPE